MTKKTTYSASTTEPKAPYGSGMRNIVLLWLVWVLTVIGFQALATARLQPQRPDMMMWLPGDPTDVNFYQQGHPYLLEPFMNNQVWVELEFYLGIAIGGYDDPCMMAMNIILPKPFVPCTDPEPSKVILANNTPEVLAKITPLSYAFFPFYPILIHLLAIPLSLLQLNPIATATLAAVMISALGALAAMLALYDLTYEALGKDGGMRAVFYLLIFPTSFYFVQVYTEGLFVGLAFTCLAMLKRKHLVYAALLAGAAVLTRAVGMALIIPMAITWISAREWSTLDLKSSQFYFKRPFWRLIGRALLTCTPLIVFLIWKFSYYGSMFDYVEENMFGRPPLYINIAKGFTLWTAAFQNMMAGFLHLPYLNSEQIASPQYSANYFVEFSCMVIGLIAILRCLKTDPEVAWFSLAAFLIPLLSGPPGIHRYLLAAPAVFITLARWGKNPVFDRAWTLASLLVMGLLAMLFAFNFWVS